MVMIVVLIEGKKTELQVNGEFNFYLSGDENVILIVK